jgi:zinc/manganese transport system permease protein
MAPMTLYDALLGPFVEFDFMRRALVGSLALALGAGPIGVFLMLRRMSLAGDAMAHAILPGAAAGFLVAGLSLPAMTIGGLVAGVSVALAAGLVTRTTALKEDAALAAFYLLSLALGVTLVSLKGSNVDLLHVLFGSVLALDDDALVLLAGVATVTLVTLALIYRPLVLECVDPGFLASVSRMGGPTHLIFLGLVVLNLVAGFQALGTLLSVGVMMLPAACAPFWSARLGGMFGVSVAVGSLASVVGLLGSYHSGVPTGPSIILAAGILYLGSIVFGPVGGFAWRLLPARRHRAA